MKFLKTFVARALFNEVVGQGELRAGSRVQLAYELGPGFQLSFRGLFCTYQWRKGCDLHRLDGPAWFKQAVPSNVIVEEVWAKDGLLHRDGGPALVRRNPTDGSVSEEIWALEGVICRPDGPSHIRYQNNAPLILREGAPETQNRVHLKAGPRYSNPSIPV